jgi:hypothetical protein
MPLRGSDCGAIGDLSLLGLTTLLALSQVSERHHTFWRLELSGWQVVLAFISSPPQYELGCQTTNSLLSESKTFFETFPQGGFFDEFRKFALISMGSEDGDDGGR